MSGVPTVTISSSVFSTFITSSHLIFERQKNTPHYLGSKPAKSKGLSGKFYKFFSHWLFLRFGTWNYTLFVALSVSRWKYTFSSKTDTFRYCRYTKQRKTADIRIPTAYKRRLLKYRRTGDKGGSPSGSAATARSRALLSFVFVALFVAGAWTARRSRAARLFKHPP